MSKSTLCVFFCFFLVSHYLSAFLLRPCLFFFLARTNTRAHPTSSAVLPLSLCFRWCRCCGRLIEMREEMTAPCISASLQSPALPSTSASGTAAVGTQPPPLPLHLPILFLYLLIPSLCQLHTSCLFSSSLRKIPPSSLFSPLLSCTIHLPIVLPTVTHFLSHTHLYFPMKNLQRHWSCFI